MDQILYRIVPLPAVRNLREVFSDPAESLDLLHPFYPRIYPLHLVDAEDRPVVRRGDIAAEAVGNLGGYRSSMGVGVEPVNGLLSGTGAYRDIGGRIARMRWDRWDAQGGEAVGVSGRMEQGGRVYWIVQVAHEKRRLIVSDQPLQYSDGPVGLLDPGGLSGLPFYGMPLVGEMGG